MPGTNGLLCNTAPPPSRRPCVLYGALGTYAVRLRRLSKHLLGAAVFAPALLRGLSGRADLGQMSHRRQRGAAGANRQTPQAGNAISVTNPEALVEADSLDAERRAGAARGPLHGIPVIVKDNYETVRMQTADGSKSLAGFVPPPARMGRPRGPGDGRALSERRYRLDRSTGL
jgi:hypothetical protein